MVMRTEERPPEALAGADLIGKAPDSPAGPIEDTGPDGLRTPPTIPLPRAIQVLRFNQRQIEFVFRARRELGDVFRMRGTVGGDPVITAHPDHVRSLFVAKPEQAPSLTGESPLRPIVGPNSVLTAIGERHMRQRKLLLPPFHGDAIDRYTRMIATVAEREIERWPLGRPFALAPRMQAITLDVIMSGIFGIEGRPRPGTAEHWLRQAVKRLVAASTWPVAQLAELMNIGRDEPVGATKVGLTLLDMPTYAVIAQRRRADDLDQRRDILSLLLLGRTDGGKRSRIASCATSSSPWCWPATRRPPTRSPGRGSAWYALPSPTSACARRCGRTTRRRKRSRVIVEAIPIRPGGSR